MMPYHQPLTLLSGFWLVGKVLELQACKKLNEDTLKTLCELGQRHVSQLLGMCGYHVGLYTFSQGLKEDAGSTQTATQVSTGVVRCVFVLMLIIYLVMRKEPHARLSLNAMKTLWDTTLDFVGAIEALSGTLGYGLKSTLLTQVLLDNHRYDAMACDEWNSGGLISTSCVGWQRLNCF